MTRECPGCAVETDFVEESCPVCGYELPRHTNRFRLVGLVAGLAFALPTIWAGSAFLHGC